MSKRLAIAITGPTAAGKTAVGIEVAKALGGEIVSVDSRQIFRHMDIGTAKPTPAERARVIHHFVDVRQPTEEYSAGRFGADARRCINELLSRKVVPVLVGGSGLYMRAILDGLFDEPAAVQRLRPQLLQRLRTEGLAALYAELATVDPVGHARIAPQDTQRILRALEVGLGAGESLTNMQQGEAGASLAVFPLLFGIGMERKRLYARIEDRVEDMIRRGLCDEVADLKKMGYGRHTRAMGTMGYREVLDYVDGVSTLQTAVDLVKRRSKQYAKRQLTWFRKDRRVRWIDLDTWNTRGVVSRILSNYYSQQNPKFHCFQEDAFAVDS